jgi:hypothetical protein
LSIKLALYLIAVMCIVGSQLFSRMFCYKRYANYTDCETLQKCNVCPSTFSYFSRSIKGTMQRDRDCFKVVSINRVLLWTSAARCLKNIISSFTVGLMVFSVLAFLHQNFSSSLFYLEGAKVGRFNLHLAHVKKRPGSAPAIYPLKAPSAVPPAFMIKGTVPWNWLWTIGGMDE